MKKLLFIVLIALFACAAFAESITDEELAEALAEIFNTSSDAETQGTMCVTADVLNVRDGNGNKVSSLNQGAKVTTYETKFMNGETFVRIGNNQYVAQRFLGSCGSAPTPSGDKYTETLGLIFGHEGQCQNWASDVGNTCQGKLGYTCMGITPCVAYSNRQQSFAYASGFNGHPADFCKYAYDLNRDAFKKGAADVYRRNYFYVCDALSQPAFYICADISVNSGPGKSQEFLNKLNGCRNLSSKDCARQMNQMHREFYQYIGRPGTSNNKFLAGWLARADARDRYINQF
jgi:hypothetical protein